MAKFHYADFPETIRAKEDVTGLSQTCRGRHGEVGVVEFGLECPCSSLVSYVLVTARFCYRYSTAVTVAGLMPSSRQLCPFPIFLSTSPPSPILSLRC